MPDQLQMPRIVRLLYNHNPFYVISAACIIYTLKLAFRPGEVSYIDPWSLMGAIAGYTVLMAITGFLVVKLGHVWEDARMIFLVILLLFFATSTTFDELLNLKPADGKLLIYSGLALAVLVTESLLLGLKIQLPVLFRIPYYLWLGLLYLFPIWVSPEVTGLNLLDTSWRLLAFPVFAGAIALCLLPAVWRGANYCANNGTPWSWPLYPWTMFFFLMIATPLRTYALTISFLPSNRMETAFQPYFLAPFAFAVCLVLLEMGVVERRPRLVDSVLNLSPALLLLSQATTSASGPSSMFLNSLVVYCGSPLWMTAWGLVALHVIALARRIPRVERRLLLSLVPFIWIGPQSLNWQTLSAPQPWPLAVIGLFELAQALRQRRSLPALAGAMCLSGALSVWLWDSDWFVYRRIVPYHAALVSVLLIGGVFRDFSARVLRIIGAILLPVTAAASLVIADGLVFSNLAWGSYLASLTLLCVGCWAWTRDRAYLYAFLSMVIAGSGESIYLSILWAKRTVGFKILIPLGLGIVSFLFAIVISAVKAGVGQARLKRWGLLREQLE